MRDDEAIELAKALLISRGYEVVERKQIRQCSYLKTIPDHAIHRLRDKPARLNYEEHLLRKATQGIADLLIKDRYITITTAKNIAEMGVDFRVDVHCLIPKEYLDEQHNQDRSGQSAAASRPQYLDGSLLEIPG